MEKNTGIIFRRGTTEIPATIDFIGDTDFCTCLVKDNQRISTVEHLLSALSALHIDNCIAELSLDELPVLDGSAKPFVDLILSAGIAEQAALKKFIKIKKTIEANQGDKWARLEPFDGFCVAMEISFTHPIIASSQQVITLDVTQEKYIEEISRARTFGFLADYEMMLAKKLAKGASLENTVVLDAENVVNPEGLRYPDEFVKHKMLDAIGDLYLLGHPMIGKFSGFKSGHALNSALMKKLLADVEAFEICS